MTTLEKQNFLPNRKEGIKTTASQASLWTYSQHIDQTYNRILEIYIRYSLLYIG